MPDPGSHRYDIQRSRLRAEAEDRGVPDQHADRAANEELRREHPPRPTGDPERAAGPKGTRDNGRGDGKPAATGFVLRSAAFSDHTVLPERYSYGGANVSPPLEWSGTPDGTEELALICEDPDAPGGTFVHWVVTNISPKSTGMEEGALPAGAVVGRNGFGELGWGGPQPPVGDQAHRYFFRLHALRRPQAIVAGADADEVRARIDDDIIATATLVGLFGR